MKLDMALLPHLVFTLVGPICLYFDLGWKSCVALILLSLTMFWMRNLMGLRFAKKGLVLETLTASHYVERVRWTMDRMGIQYTEQPRIGIFGVLFFGKTVPSLHDYANRVHISDSSHILRYLYGRFCVGYDCFVPDGSRKLNESPDFLKPTEEAVKLETTLQEFGIHVRRFAYFYSLSRPHITKKIWGMHHPLVPAWQKVVLAVCYPLFVFSLKKLLNINAVTAEKSLKKMMEVFDQVDALLSDGRKYLLGKEMTYIDITWAALAAIIIFPEQYGGAAIHGQELFKAADFGPRLKAVSDELRKRPAGQFVLRLYKEERHIKQ